MPDSSSWAREERLQLVQRLALLDDGVADVGPVEAGDVTRRLGEAQPEAHVVACLRVGGGGAREDRHVWEELSQLAELHVLRAEVVPPLADAVRLVDGEQGDARARRGAAMRARRRRARPAGARGSRRHERLGRDVQEVQLAGVQGAQHASAPRPASSEEL